ncbi:MAG: type I-B CRISPR-associated protein Cas7/Csh2 [Thermoplasmata archaeon]
MGAVGCNSEILFLYDAKLTNPNGDPDEENRPRMDYETGRNLVSDVRLKRYLRDYWIGMKKDVWIRRVSESVEEKTVSAKQRIEMLAQEFGKKNAKEAQKDPEFKNWLLEKLIDIRLFGATMPIGEGEGARGASLTLTGPVQFSWGYSLNRVEILPSSTITSTFAGRETGEKGEHGTMGKDWRVKYSFIAFYGLISAWRAKHTGLTEEDVRFLDESMLKALPLEATTRSKIGQTPRLYLRVEYRDDKAFLGDLRNFISLEPAEGISDISDTKLNSQELVRLLEENTERIHRISYWKHPDLLWEGPQLEERLNPLVTSLTTK